MEKETLSVQELVEYIEKHFDQQVVPSLMDYIRIDNLSRSYDPEWQTNGKLLKAAQHIQSWIQTLQIQGLTCEVLQDQGFSPLIFTEVKGDVPATLFFYGHYDKQPPFTGWMEGLGPTEPKIMNGKLYGRGGADDGYATYSTMLALKALQQMKVPLPRCVMITEGDEESGSGHMPHYLEKLKERIGDPLVFFCLDSGCLDYQRLWLTTSLRGNMVATLKIKTSEEALHSGSYSGVYPSVFRILRILMNRLENFQTGEINSNFFVDIPPNRYKQMEETARLFGSTVYNNFPLYQNTQPLTTNPLQCLIQRNWQPTVTMTGQNGFPSVQQAGNVLLPQIEARFSVRIPPTMTADKALGVLKEILLKDPPYGAQVEVSNTRAAAGWNSADFQSYFDEAVKEASLAFFGKSMCSFGMGGAIPLMGMLQNIWPGRPFLITGVLGPLSNAHGPNQFLHLAFAKKLTCVLAYVVAKSSKHHGKE